MKTEPTLDKKQLEELYWTRKLSIAKIATILNCSVTKTHYWLIKYGIKRREKFSKELKITKELLTELYVDQKLPLSEIAKKFDCNNTNILYWMKKFNIKRRPAYRKKIHIPKKRLDYLYWKKNLSSSEIAQRF
ncbi:MAG: transposase, partial [Nanoarchaeota archaeon]|nr:transposase [Nanoarchaeota archaeon]